MLTAIKTMEKCSSVQVLHCAKDEDYTIRIDFLSLVCVPESIAIAFAEEYNVEIIHG